MNNINGISRGSIRGVFETQKVREGDANKDSNSSDKLALTRTAVSLPGLAQTLAEEPPMDAARVNQIKAQIIGGNYQIDAEQVAAKYLHVERAFGHL